MRHGTTFKNRKVLERIIELKFEGAESAWLIELAHPVEGNDPITEESGTFKTGDAARREWWLKHTLRSAQNKLSIARGCTRDPHYIAYMEETNAA